MFNLEGFIPKLCEIARESGEVETKRTVWAAGLQVLSSMELFCNAVIVLSI
jgi:hypothetical protein